MKKCDGKKSGRSHKFRATDPPNLRRHEFKENDHLLREGFDPNLAEASTVDGNVPLVWLKGTAFKKEYITKCLINRP